MKNAVCSTSALFIGQLASAQVARAQCSPSWAVRSAISPSARSARALAYDSQRGRIVRNPALWSGGDPQSAIGGALTPLTRASKSVGSREFAGVRNVQKPLDFCNF